MGNIWKSFHRLSLKLGYIISAHRRPGPGAARGNLLAYKKKLLEFYMYIYF